MKLLRISFLVASLLIGLSISVYAQGLITITAPANGTILKRGRSFTLTFTADPSVSNIAVNSAFTGIVPQSSPGTVSLSIPANTTIQQYPLSVIGLVNGQFVSSNPISIQVDTPLTITTLDSSALRSIKLAAIGHTARLVLTGILSDGTNAFVTYSPQLTFASNDPTIATVDSFGRITAVGAGSTAITINGTTNGSYSVPVTVATAPPAPPILSPSPGTFGAPLQVTLSYPTSGATLYYTLDGSPPTPNSALYTGPFVISSTATINALAVVSGQRPVVAWGTYVINTSAVAATPMFSPAAGTFTSVQSISISDATTGATIYYTLDGSTPTNASTIYNSPVSVTKTETIQAIAVASGYTNSAVASATYTINIPTAATPAFSPTAGTFTTAQTVTISDSTAGAAIYYTTNGTTPTTSSTLYSGPITVSGSETIQAIAVANGYSNSPIASAAYTINLPQDFTFGLSTSSLSIAPGQSGTLTASVGPVNGFNQPISFACSGLPAGVACSFSPAVVSPNGTTSTATTITITASATAALLTGNRPYEFAGLLAGLSLFIAGRRFRKVRHIGVLFLLTIGVGLIANCGGGTPSTSTPPKTSAVSINATSGSLTHTASLSLTVQ